jgi:hypothetical protein
LTNRQILLSLRLSLVMAVGLEHSLGIESLRIMVLRLDEELSLSEGVGDDSLYIV